MLQARDIMTKNVIYVKRNTPIYEAAEMLLKHEITGMPVVNEELDLVGIITEKDLLRLLRTHEDEKDKIVEDFMTEPALFFQENESLNDICEFMITNHFRRVPVTSSSSKKKLVGVVSRPDVLKCIVKMYHTRAETICR